MIHGPYDAAERAYRHVIDKLDAQLERTYPPGAAGPGAMDLAQKEAFIEREMAAARVHELAQIAQSLEHLRQRLLSIDMPGNAGRLNDTIIDLMQHWLDERAQR